MFAIIDLCCLLQDRDRVLVVSDFDSLKDTVFTAFETMKRQMAEPLNANEEVEEDTVV